MYSSRPNKPLVVLQRTAPLHVSGTNVQNIRDIFFHMLFSLLYRSEIIVMVL